MGYDAIKALAKQKGIPLEDIAKHAGLSYNSLSKIIRNTIKEPRLTTMQLIAQALGMTIDELSVAVGLTPRIMAHEKCATDAAPLVGSECQLLELFRTLNEEGQGRLLDYADDLAQSGKYIKNNQHQMGAELA